MIEKQKENDFAQKFHLKIRFLTISTGQKHGQITYQSSISE